MVDIVGKDVVEIFIFKNKYDFFYFMRDFEVKKSIINFELDGLVIFIVLVSLLEIFFEKNLGSIIMDVVLNFKYKN